MSSLAVKNEGEAREKQQIFGAGGVADQAATGLSIAATTPAPGRTARIEAIEAITLAGSAGTEGDRLLTKPGSDADFIQRNIANANPEFSFRNLTTRDLNTREGGSDLDVDGLDILDGVASGDAVAMLRGSSDQTADDTTVALQSLFTKAYAVEQSRTKPETPSTDVSTHKLIDANPFDGYSGSRVHKHFGDASGSKRKAADDSVDVREEGDPLLSAAKDDGLEFYFGAGSSDSVPEGDEAAKPQSYSQRTMQASGLRRVGMRKTQSTVLEHMEKIQELDQMQRGFDIIQRSDGDWDSYDKLDKDRLADIEKLRFPGAQYLAHQPSMLNTMSTRTASSRAKNTKKNKGASGTMGSTAFA